MPEGDSQKRPPTEPVILASNGAQTSVELPNLGLITLRKEVGGILVDPEGLSGLSFSLHPDGKTTEVMKRGLKRLAEARGIEDVEEDIACLQTTIEPLLQDIGAYVWDFEKLDLEIQDVRRDPILGRISFLLHGWNFVYLSSELMSWKKVRSDLLAHGIVLKIPMKARECWESLLASVIQRASVDEGDPGSLPEAFALSQIRAAISTLERLPLNVWKDRGGQGVALDLGETLLISSEKIAEVARNCGVTLESLSYTMSKAKAKVGNSVERHAGNRKGCFWPVLTSWVDKQDVEGVEGQRESIGGGNNSAIPPTPPPLPTCRASGDNYRARVKVKITNKKLPQTIETIDNIDIPLRAREEEK